MQLAAERCRGANGQLDGALVQYGQRARKSEADRTDVRVGRRTEIGRAPTKRLRDGLELHMDLEPDDHLVGIRHRISHRCASPARARSRAYAAANIWRSSKCGAMN